MQSEKTRFVTFYNLTKSEKNQIAKRLKEENPAELKKIIDDQAGQIKKLENQIKILKNQQQKLLEEQKVSNNVSTKYEKELQEIKNQLKDLKSTVEGHYYRISNLSYALDTKSSPNDDQTEKKFQDMSARIDDLSASLDKKADKSKIQKIEDKLDKLSELLDKKTDKPVKKENGFESLIDSLADSDFFVGFMLILSLILFVASNSLLIYFQAMGRSILELWLDALILLGVSLIPWGFFCIVVGISFNTFGEIGEFRFGGFLSELIEAFGISLLVAAVGMVIINFAAFDILYYFIH